MNDTRTRRLAVLNVVGLSKSVLGLLTPRIGSLARDGALCLIRPAFPAVTCTAQSNYLTGKPPAGHGIVGNGWFDRSLAEVQFWKQSNALVAAPKVWEDLRLLRPGLTCAKLFWWYNMYSTADYSITPRPMYPADGRKVFDVYSWPYSIRTEIKAELGSVPFPTFWGPAAGVKSPQGEPEAASAWIAASARWIENRYRPHLSLVYLPHLDYNLQRFGTKDPRVEDDIRRVDTLVGGLLDFYRERDVEVLVLSEYGITDVDHPVHLNRLFRSQGWLAIKEELGLEQLDTGASQAFAVADHQVAHVYVKDPQLIPVVRDFLLQQPGIQEVLGAWEKPSWGIDHPRAGDLVAVAAPRSWFTYYYWNEDALAPDFARCVDIHRKPGYDPVELFLDPDIPAVKLKILLKLLRKKLGFRMLMDVIPLNAGLVRGSHGRRPEDKGDWPVMLSTRAGAFGGAEEMDSLDVARAIKAGMGISDP